MTRKWILGVGAALALVIVVGTGFAAFTATATVNGKATAGSVQLAIVNANYVSCGGFSGVSFPGPGNFTFFGENEARTSISLSVSNLTPDAWCQGYVELENVGSVPVNLSVTLNTPGSNGVCGIDLGNCTAVTTSSGINEGWQLWYGGPTGLTTVSNFATLAPGALYVDYVAVGIAGGSTDVTPATATFSLVYTASAGF
jgi:hypothetical protein